MKDQHSEPTTTESGAGQLVAGDHWVEWRVTSGFAGWGVANTDLPAMKKRSDAVKQLLQLADEQGLEVRVEDPLDLLSRPA